MRSHLILSALALLLALPAPAEQLFFRNRPFKGPSAGRGAAVTVGLKEAAAVFGLPVVEKNGGYAVGSASEPSTGQVLVNGTAVTSVQEGGVLQVNLKEFAAAAQLTYKANRDLDSIDVIGSAPRGGGAAGAAASPVAEGAITLVNGAVPGDTLDIRTLPAAGVYTFLLVYRDGFKDEVYRSYFKRVDKAAKLPKVAVCKVNYGSDSNPIIERLQMSPSPTLFIFGPNRGCYAIYGGHVMEPIIENPQLGIDEVAGKMKDPLRRPFPIK